MILYRTRHTKVKTERLIGLVVCLITVAVVQLESSVSGLLDRSGFKKQMVADRIWVHLCPYPQDRLGLVFGLQDHGGWTASIERGQLQGQSRPWPSSRRSNLGSRNWVLGVHPKLAIHQKCWENLFEQTEQVEIGLCYKTIFCLERN